MMRSDQRLSYKNIQTLQIKLQMQIRSFFNSTSYFLITFSLQSLAPPWFFSTIPGKLAFSLCQLFFLPRARSLNTIIQIVALLKARNAIKVPTIFLTKSPIQKKQNLTINSEAQLQIKPLFFKLYSPKGVQYLHSIQQINDNCINNVKFHYQMLFINCLSTIYFNIQQYHHYFQQYEHFSIIIGHFLNQQKQLMHHSYNRKIAHLQQLIDNSMNDDSLLHQFIHNHKFHNQFEINSETNGNAQGFGKPHQTQNLIPSSLPALGKNKKTSVQQVLKRNSSERQSTNLSLISKSNENLHDEQNHLPSCGSTIMDFHRKYSQQHEEEKQTAAQEQKKKQKQRFLQEQKQKLQKLREENQKFIESKKQNDQKINEFKNQLINLNKIKQKQITKSQQNIKLLQAQEYRKNEKKFYEAMMQQKLVLNKILSQKQIQQRQKVIEKEQSCKVMEIQNKISKPKLSLDQIKKNAQQKRKINEIRDLSNKRRSCQQKSNNQQFKLVRQNSKPIKQRSGLHKNFLERRLNVKSLSASEIYRMGQQFMQKAHVMISPELIEKSKVEFEKRTRQMNKSSRREYTDYLKQYKFRRTRGIPEIRELRNLIIGEQNSAEKLVKAKLISDRLDLKQQSKKCTRLKIDSIAAKLKIIQEFS